MSPAGGSRSPYKEFGGARGGPARRAPPAPPFPSSSREEGTQLAQLWARGADTDGAGGKCQGSLRLAPEGPDVRARCSGPLGRGPVSFSAASPCPRCSGNPAWAAGRRARPSRSTWLSWGAAGRASPVSGQLRGRKGVRRESGRWSGWREPGTADLQAGSSTGFGGFLNPGGLGKTP